jgi:hypothetical protein
MVDGVRGGRSTHGICYGALAWLVEDGRIGDVDVSGLATALIVRYDDDEPGSPWTIVLHVDDFANFGPRVGIAWNPDGKGRTAVRAGYGIFVESPGVGFVENNVFANPPFVGTTTINGGPFDSLVGMIQEPPNAKGRVRVLVNLLNQQTRVEIPTRFIDAGWVTSPPVLAN